MTIYDWSKVPAKLWAELGHELCAADRWSDMRLELLRAVQAVQAAAETRVPLRTRADVDAALVARVRLWFEHTKGAFMTNATRGDLAELCREPTDPNPAPCSCSVIARWNCPVHGSANKTYGPRSVDDRGFPPGCDPATGATFHKRVAEALGLMDGDMGNYIYADEDRCLEEVAKNRSEAEMWSDHVRKLDEAHPDLPDPEPCGCEEAEALKDRLSERGKVISAAYDLAKQLHDLLAVTP